MSNWCSHIVKNGKHNQSVWVLNPKNYFEVDDVQLKVSCDWDFCPICSAPRPEEKKMLLINKLIEIDDLTFDERLMVCSLVKTHIINKIKDLIDERILRNRIIKAIEEC